MATSKAKYPYIDLEASDVEERDGDRFTGRLVNDKPYAGGKYEYNAPDAPEAGGGRGFINPPMAVKEYTGKMEVKGELPKGYRHKKEPSEPVSKARGGKISSASSRADGIAQRGKTRGKLV